ncbi:hypothetical protein IFM89_019394, partial [Coptis chinensis]
ASASRMPINCFGAAAVDERFVSRTCRIVESSMRCVGLLMGVMKGLRFILGIIVRSIEQKVLFNKDCNSNIRQDESFSISLFIRNPNRGKYWRIRGKGFAIVIWTQCGRGRCSWSTSGGCYLVPLQLSDFFAIVVDAAVASGIASEKGTRKDGPPPPDSLGRVFIMLSFKKNL